MDWDKKFSTIVHETEVNLDRVRRRLEAARSSTDKFSPRSTDKFSPRSSGNNLLLSSFPETASKTIELSPSKTASNGPPIWATLLEEKLLKQKQIIDNLTDTVVSLQNDRVKQKATIHDLKESLSVLQERMKEKGVDVSTENKFYNWKIKADNELQELKLQHYKQNDASNLSARTSVEELKLQVTETKSICRDEIESVKRELDHYRTRITRLESNMSQLGDRISDLNRHHLELKSNVNEFNASTKHNYRDLSNVIQTKFNEMTVTRSELASLKDSLKDITLSDGLTQPKDTRRLPTTKSPHHSLSNHKPVFSRSLSSLSIDSTDSSVGSDRLGIDKPDDSIAIDDLDKHLPGGVDIETDSGSISSRPSTPSSLSLNDL